MTKSKNNAHLQKKDIIIITLMILQTILPNLPFLNTLFASIYKLEYQFGMPILLTIQLTILVLFVMLALNYIRKLYKIAEAKRKKLKTRKQKLRDKVFILNSINNSLKWYLHCKYQDLKIPEHEFNKYIESFINKNLIKQNGIFDIRNGLIKTPIFVLTEKGLNFLNKHKGVL